MPNGDLPNADGASRWNAMAALWRADARLRILAFAALIVAFTILANIIMLRTTGWSALWPLRTWLIGADSESGDSWNVMNLALEWLRAHPGGALYQEIFFERQIRFQYAPTSLLPLVALEGLGLETSAPFMNGLNRIFIAATAACVSVLSFRLLTQESMALRWGAAALTAGATLLFYPVMMAGHLGQLQVWINAFFAFACLAWLTERRALAGVLIGLICLLKPQFGLFALWALVRKEWNFLIALCVTGAAGLLASVLLFGLPSHLAYLNVLSFLSRHGEAYWANQSLNGVLHRLLGSPGASEWTPNQFPPFSPLIYAGTLAATIAILAFALWLKRGEGRFAALLDFQLAALAFTAASPIAWEHHYGVAAPIAATLFCVIVRMEEGARRAAWLTAFAIAFVFAANCLTFTRAWADPPVNLAQSTLFFAALALIVMLRRLVRA